MSRKEKENGKFDSYKELIEMSVDRLVYLLEYQLHELALYTYEPIIDKNDIYKKCQELIITLKAIKLKLNIGLDYEKQK